MEGQLHEEAAELAAAQEEVVAEKDVLHVWLRYVSLGNEWLQVSISTGWVDSYAAYVTSPFPQKKP